jgi:hypothetical protein
MKRLGVVFIFSLLSVYCFAQSQMGDASYNASKSGFTIAHPSMSFGTRVRITNLRNNSEVIATVDGRIPTRDPRIADISREAGDAIGMSRSGYTEVRIEQLPREQQPAAASASASAPVPSPPAEQARQAPAPEPAPAATSPEPREEIIQTVTLPQVQYVPAPVVERFQNCPLSPAVIVLLALVVALLTAILVLLIHARRTLWWHGYPWFIGRYPLWARRSIRHQKKRRNDLTGSGTHTIRRG